MGVDFRRGTYVRRVLFGKRTIKDGEAAAIWNCHGQHRQVIGPALVRLCCSTLRFLDRHVANPSEYLRIEHADGHIQHVPGPTAMYHDPLQHRFITVCKAIQLLNSSDAVVLYRPVHEKPSSTHVQGKLQRVVVVGPAVIIPEVGEHVHTFKWSTVDEHGALKRGTDVFTVLSLSVRKWVVRVSARTQDGASVDVELSVRFGIDGAARVEAMMDSSEDPMSEMYVAVQSDVCHHSCAHKATDFQAGMIRDALSTLDSYPRLQACANTSGLLLDSVSYVSFTPSSELAATYTTVAALEAKLAAEAAAAEQRLRLDTLELSNQRQHMEAQHDLQRAQHAFARELEREDGMHKAELEKLASSCRVQEQVARDTQALCFLQALGEQGVDVTRVLCAVRGGVGVEGAVHACSLGKVM